MSIKADAYKYRKATLSDAVEICNLMQLVYDRLEDKSIYVCDDLQYIENCISAEGFAVVALNSDNNIIGSFLMYYPGFADDNLGRDIGLKEEELCKVVHMESAVVHPDYRGRGLQLELLRFAEELIDKSRYTYFMSTISPDNPASYRTLEKNGYRHILTKEKYGGLLRRIYLKRRMSE